MNQTINATVNAAKSAEVVLVDAIHGAADALDQIARDPVANALARLRDAAADAQARLDAGRMLARSALLEALAGFEGFTQDVTAPVVEEPAPLASLPAPAVEVPIPAVPDTAAIGEVADPAPVVPATVNPLTVAPSEVVVTTAANAGASDPAPTAPLASAQMAGDKKAEGEEETRQVKKGTLEEKSKAADAVGAALSRGWASLEDGKGPGGDEEDEDAPAPPPVKKTRTRKGK